MRETLAPHFQDPVPFVAQQLDGRHILAVGEHHDSSAHHAFLCDVLREAHAKHPDIVLALELHKKWQKRVGAYVASGGTTTTRYLDAGLRRGSGYLGVLATAAELGIPIVCLDDYEGDDRDRKMALAVARNIHPDQPVVLYAGGEHVANEKKQPSLGHILKHFYGDDNVSANMVETLDDVGSSWTFGFTAQLPNYQMTEPFGLDLHNPTVRSVAAPINEGLSRDCGRILDIITKVPWYDRFDNFISLGKTTDNNL